MRTGICSLLLSTALLGAAVCAETGPLATAPADDSPPLSTEAQIERFLSHADEPMRPPAQAEPRGWHGAFGVTVGTGGGRGAYGTLGGLAGDPACRGAEPPLPDPASEVRCAGQAAPAR